MNQSVPHSLIISDGGLAQSPGEVRGVLGVKNLVVSAEWNGILEQKPAIDNENQADWKAEC